MAVLPLPIARVSNLLRTDVSTWTLANTQAQLLRVQNQLATGKRLNAPSDDAGAAAIAQQLRKTLEQRQAYSDNIKSASSQLSDVDSTMQDLTQLLDQAQTIASANVGSDVTADARKAAATQIDAIFNQVLSLSNKSAEGVYIFGGDRSTVAPFMNNAGAVQYVGDPTTLKNQFDESSTLSFQVDGNAIFGALSTRVTGTADLTPGITTATKLSSLRGTGNTGVSLGSIQISDGTTSATVDLRTADTVGDVLDAINATGLVAATIAPDGNSIQLAQASANISVSEVGGGTTASDLGLLQSAAGATLDGANVQATVTPLTNLADLRDGAGVDLTGIRITNGSKTADIDFTGATTVEDLLNKINGAGVNVRAQINASGTGIDILNPTQGTSMSISEIGGTSAADLGIRSFDASSQLSNLNGGNGVRTSAGIDFRITDSNGASYDIDVDAATPQTVQGVIDAINAQTGSNVTASFATTGNGMVLTDNAGGGGTLTVTPLNFSQAAEDLGLTGPASGNVISGADVDPVKAQGVFANLMQLRDALNGSDQHSITQAAQGLKTDYDRMVRIRGETGARIQELESRQSRLDDQNLATQSLLSQLEDVDYTKAIAQFSTLQTALQAGLATAAKSLNLSLIDFIS